MTEILIHHRIEAPELSAALNNLAEAIKGNPVGTQPVANVTPFPAQTAPVAVPDPPTTAATPDPVPVQTAAATPAPVQTGNPPASPVTTPPPVTAPAPTVVTPSPAPDPAPAVSFETLTTAGAQLLEQGKMPQLMALLRQFGVEALTQLKPEQYPDVAAGLKTLGARI